MVPSGLENYGKGCWLNSILVSLESCDAFVAVFKKYHNGKERDASRIKTFARFSTKTTNNFLIAAGTSNFLNMRRCLPIEIV
jgi:ubiquitin C-terminal hydrolase